MIHFRRIARAQESRLSDDSEPVIGAKDSAGGPATRLYVNCWFDATAGRIVGVGAATARSRYSRALTRLRDAYVTLDS